MAETTTQTAGVKKTERTRKPGGPAKKKQNKKLLIGGTALGGLLLLSHKGSGGTNAQQTDALATGELDAYQQGIQDAGQLAGLDTGSVGVQGASGGSGDGGVTASTQPATFPPGSVVDLTPGKKIKPKRKPPKHHKPPKGHGKSHKKHEGPGEKSAVQHHDGPKHTPKPAEPHRAKPAPANHRGQHPNTHRRHRQGYRRGSEVEVESPQGEGYGITVFGRTFPGAIGFRNGPPRSIPGAGIVRDVTVIYGGHNETHTFGMNSGSWHDHTRGRNPLHGRPVPRLVTSSEVG